METVRTYENSREVAILKLAELLKHPDDLNTRVPLLRKRFAKEKAAIDAQLKTGVQASLDNTAEALETLTLSEQETRDIRANMQKIDSLYLESKNLLPQFSSISQFSVIHRNFVAVEEKIRSLRQLYDKIEEIQQLFDQDRQDIYGPNANLLRVHYEIFQLEKFRDQTLHQARNSSQDVIITLKTYLRRVDILADDFTAYIWELASHMIDLLRQDCGSTIVRLVKIVEVEEQADEKAQAAETARTSHTELVTEGAKWRLAEGSSRTIKYYRVNLLEKLRESISTMFEERFAHADEDWTGALDSMNFIFDDLALVFDELRPKFPAKYRIFPFYVLEYHRHVYEILNAMLKDDLDGSQILRVLRFVREYYANMNEQLGVTEELLEPQLLDGQESTLVEDYLKLVRRKLVEWTGNLMEKSSKEFIQRQNPPEAGPDGVFGMSDATIMFQIFNQQIDVAAESNQGKLLYHVVSECHRVMKDSQKVWKDLLQSELRKQIEQPEEAAEGFPDYVMALANDEVRSAEYTEAIMKRLAPLVDGKYRAQVHEKLNTAMDGFLQVTTSARTVLLNVTFNDVTPLFQSIFTSTYYTEDLMPSIIATFQDYCQDYQAHLQPFIFLRLMDDMMEKFIILYLEAMRGKKTMFKMPVALDKIQQDVRLVYGFFSKYIPEDKMEESFDILEKMHSLLNCSRRNLSIEYFNLKQHYPEVTFVFVEEVLAKRDDLDRSVLRDVMDGIRAKSKDIEVSANTKPTILSKLSKTF